MLLLFSPPFSSVCPTLWSFGNLSLTNSPETTRMCCFSGQKGQMPQSLSLQVESHHAIRTKHRNQWQLLSTITIIQDDPVNLQTLQETHIYPHHICTNTQTYTLMLTHHIKALKGHGSSKPSFSAIQGISIKEWLHYTALSLFYRFLRFALREINSLIYFQLINFN